MSLIYDKTEDWVIEFKVTTYDNDIWKEGYQ